MQDNIEPNEIDIEKSQVVPPKFDYNKYQVETTTAAVNRIWKLFGENADLMTQTNDLSIEEVQTKFATVAEKVLEVMIQYKVPERDMQILVENFQVAIHRVFMGLKGTKDKLQGEFLARCMNARNPGDQHFAPEWATIADLFSALQAKRIEQQNDPYGFFYVTEKPKE